MQKMKLQMLSHPSTGESKNDSKGEVPVDRPWSLRFSIVFKMAAAIKVPLSQELYSELSLKNKKNKKKKRMLCLRIMVGRL